MRQIDFSKELITKLVTITTEHTKPKQTNADEIAVIFFPKKWIGVEKRGVEA